jgi:hypothetical protein
MSSRSRRYVKCPVPTMEGTASRDCAAPFRQLDPVTSLCPHTPWTAAKYVYAGQFAGKMRRDSRWHWPLRLAVFGGFVQPARGSTQGASASGDPAAPFRQCRRGCILGAPCMLKCRRLSGCKVVVGPVRVPFLDTLVDASDPGADPPSPLQNSMPGWPCAAASFQACLCKCCFWLGDVSAIYICTCCFPMFGNLLFGSASWAMGARKS